MGKFVFTADGSFHQAYKGWLIRYRLKKDVVDILEVVGLIFAILFCLFVFLIFVNKSSTEGYFLRRANTNLNNTNFNYEVAKTQILDMRRSVWDKLAVSDSYGPSINFLDAHVETVPIQE